MKNIDLGALFAGALAVLTSLAVLARDYLARAARQIGVSFVALVSSPAVWVACLAIGLASFWSGHMLGSSGKSDLRHELSRARSESTANGKKAIDAGAAVLDLENQVAKLKSENETLRTAKAVPPAGEALAAIPRRSVAVRPSVKAPAPAASWNPFQ